MLLNLKISILNTLANSFLPCLKMQEVEDKFFSVVMNEVPSIFCQVLERGKDQIDGDVKTIHEQVIEMACQMLEFLACCISYFDQEVLLEHMYSVPINILLVLHRSYNHCQDSEDIYGEVLEILTHPLGIFFQKVQMLQMALLNLLNRMSVSSDCEKDVQILSDFCLQLSVLCQLVSSLDVKIAAALWKIYTKLIVKYQSCLKHRLEVDQVLKYLCMDTEDRIVELRSFFKECMREVEDFDKMVKICSFNLKLVITICEQYKNYLGDSVNDLLHLLLILQNLSVFTFTCPLLTTQQIDAFLNCIVVAIDPLLLHVLCDRHFVGIALKKRNNDVSTSLVLPFCLLQVSILHKLRTKEVGDDDDDACYIGAAEYLLLFENIFSTLKLCEVDIFLPVRLPGIMCQGKPQRMISLYEHLCIYLCTFCASCEAKDFHALEKIMLKILLCNHDISICIICDLWCFLARYGSDDLCFSHCILLARLTKLIRDKTSMMYVSWLLRRLCKFLTTEQKQKLLNDYQHLHQDPLFGLMSMENGKYLPEILSILGKEELKLCATADVNSFIGELNIINHRLIWNSKPSVRKVACDMIQFWSKRPLSLNSPTGNTIACSLLQTASLLLPDAKGETLLELLQFATIMWLTDIDIIQFSAISFLRTWATKLIMPSTQERQILHELALLFAKAISCPQLIIQQEALQAFSVLAHSTPHQSVIPEFLRIAPHLQKLLTSYLSKSSSEGILTMENKRNLLIQQENLMKANLGRGSFKAESIDSNSEEVCNTSENPLKKQCLEIDKSEKFSTEKISSSEVGHEINMLKTAIEKLEALQPLPEWAVQDLNMLAKKIISLS